MKKIEMFETTDGKLFKKEDEASKHENFKGEVDKLIEIIGGRDNEKNHSKFANGDFYLQLTKDQVEKFKIEFENLLKYREPWIYEQCGMKGIVGRYLCDSSSLLYSAYIHMCCIDYENRRWGQPYFANNPNPKAKLINNFEDINEE